MRLQQSMVEVQSGEHAVKLQRGHLFVQARVDYCSATRFEQYLIIQAKLLLLLTDICEPVFRVHPRLSFLLISIHFMQLDNIDILLSKEILRRPLKILRLFAERFVKTGLDFSW